MGYLPWLVLILAFGTFKDNRNSKTLYILIPLLIINFFWMLFKTVTGTTSSSAIELDVTFYSLLIGLCVLWLSSHKLSKLHGLIRFLLILIIMTVILTIGIFTTFSYFNKTTILIFTLYVFVVIAMLLGFTCAGKLCKKKYNPKVFMLWLALFMPVCAIFAMLGYLIVGNAIMNSTLPTSVYLQIIIFGLIVGFIIYAINVPFLIVGFVIPFYRERFCDFLRLKTSLENEEIEPNVENNSV